MPFSQKHCRTFQCNFCARVFSSQKGVNIHITLVSCFKNKPLHVPQPKQLSSSLANSSNSSNSFPSLPKPKPDGNSTSIIEHFPGAARIYKHGNTALDDFDEDQYAPERLQNLYYPWSSREEWQLARFLLQSTLSRNEIDDYLKLELVSCSSIFRNSTDKIFRPNEVIFLSRQPKSW